MGLTRRELQILALIGRGFDSRDIAAQLGITPYTARKHRNNLTRKLDVHSTVHLTVLALAMNPDSAKMAPGIDVPFRPMGFVERQRA